MKFRYTYMFLAGLLPLGIAGCASSRTEGKVSVNGVKTLTPDSVSSVNIDVVFRVPEKAFSRRSRLIMVPQLVYRDTMVTECKPLVLDAPVYSKKMERKEKLSGYVDTLASVARKVDNGQDYDIPYTDRLTIPDGVEGGRIIAVLSSDGCGECGIVDTVDVAHIANLPALVEPKKSLKLNWIEPEFVIRPKVMQGKGEALLQFVINRYDINLSLGNNDSEMNRMLATLQKITGDTLATLNSVSIYGMASADGSYAFNTTLARNRANFAKNWLVGRLGVDVSVGKNFSIGSRPEGWIPVLQAMTADGHPDSLKVKAILDKYNAENDDVAERHIRRLSCWKDIRNRYLQKDRKVEYVYTYTLRSFTTDAELLDMYGKRPDAFNEEELLRVSTLKRTDKEKAEVYRTILHYFPQSQVAANNLAVLLLREGRTDEAEQVLDGLKEYSPEVLNTKAALYVYRNEYERAVELLGEQKELPEARYNLALLKARERKLEEAYELIREYNDVNAAIIALSTNRNDRAEEMMRHCKNESPLACYVHALIAARKGDCAEACRNLRKAVSDAGLKMRMAEEPDFMPCHDRKEFDALAKGGLRNE